MAVKFANLASSTLASSLSNSATSISVADASSFPTLGSGDYFYASIGEGSLSEIVKVTAVSSNTLTVVRGQDSTTARSHDSGTSVALRVVAAALDDIASQAQTAADTESVSISGDTMTGVLLTQMDIRSAGMIRATGWYNDTASTDYYGSAIEIGTSGSHPTILAYNRSNSSYQQMIFGANTFKFNTATTFNIATADFQIGGTTVIDSSRNLTNIGTISSGAITSSGLIKGTRAATSAHVDYAQFHMPSWSGHAGYLKSLVWQDGTGNIAAIGAEYDGSKTNIHFHSQYNSGYESPADKTFSVYGNGNVNVLNNFLINGTLRIAQNGNATLGTISSGSISTSGTITGDQNQNAGYVHKLKNTNTGTSAYTEFTVENGSQELRIGTSQNYSSGQWDGSWVYADTGDLFLKSGLGHVKIYAGDTVNPNWTFNADGSIRRGDYNGTTFVDSSRNITAGTISSGAITSSGNIALASNGNLWIGNQADSGDRGRFHQNGSNLFIDWNSDLYLRSGATTSSNRVVINSSGIDIKSGGLLISGLSAIDSSRNATLGTISGSLASSVTATTQSASDNSTKVATTAYVDSAVSGIVDSAPGTLNTLNELAAALGDDANFSTTVTNSIATKLPLAGGTMTGTIDSHVGDSGVILKSGNSSATGTPDQFKINHNLGNVEIQNVRGSVNFPTVVNFTNINDINVNGTLNLGTSSSSNHFTGHYFHNRYSNNNVYVHYYPQGNTTNSNTYFRFPNGSSYRALAFEGANMGWAGSITAASTIEAGSSVTGAEGIFGSTSGSNQGIQIKSGTGSNDYGRIRYYEGASTQRNTIHLFGRSWQSGSLTGHATGSINLDGDYGVTFGAWNNIDAYVDGSGIHTSATRGYYVGSTAVIDSAREIKFTKGSSGTLASRTGFSDFIGYNPSYGSYIGGGVSNGGAYIYAGGYISLGGVVTTLLHTGNDDEYLNRFYVSGSTTWASIANNSSTNVYWLDVVNTSASDRPQKDDGTLAYPYGIGLSINRAGRGALQMYAPEQDGATSGGFYYRSGWNGNLRSWQRVYDEEFHPEVDNADTVDNLHASQFLRSDANDTATGSIVFNGATQYFRKNNAANYTNASLLVESYGGSSSIAAMGFHISGSIGRMLSMNSSGTLSYEGDFVTQGAHYVQGSLNVQHTSHNYLYLNSTGSLEQMVRFKNGLANDWYAGLRTSAGLVSTADFHIYSAAYGNDVFAITTGGNAVVANDVVATGIYNNTSSGGLKVGGFSTANTDETGGTVVTWQRGSGWDNYLIKGSTSRGVFGTQFIGEHIDSSKSWGVFSSGWDTEFQINGDGRSYIKGPFGVGAAPSTSDARLVVTGLSNAQGTANFTPHSDKGIRESHIHYGGTGDWYIRSASTSGTVHIQDGGGAAMVNGSTIWHAGNDGSGSGLDADTLDGFHKDDFDHFEKGKKWAGISASGAQARRFHIARLYGCPAHWDSNWQNIEFHVTAESYESATLKFRIQGDYNGGNQNTMLALYLTEAHGPLVNYFRFVMGTPVSAGWNHSGQPTYYVDLFAEAKYYSAFTVHAKTYGHSYQTSNPSGGGATTVFYSSPTVSNISNFSVNHINPKHLGYTVWNAGNHGSGSGLDADLLDGQHGSYYATASNLSGHTGNSSIHQNWGLFSTNGGQDFLGRGKRVAVATTSNLILNYGSDFTNITVDSPMTVNGTFATLGNTNLGNGNGDTTHVNDILYVGATDSGDSHFYFGENSSNWYGEHWYWDSGHTTNRYSRHAGTDSLIEKHDTRYTHKIQVNRAYERLAHDTGYQIGSYNSVAGNSFYSNPIYVIGDNYRPSASSLGSMYGVGYSHPNASFWGSGKTSDWGFYVVANGSLNATIGAGAITAWFQNKVIVGGDIDVGGSIDADAKRHDLGASSSWDSVGFSHQTNLHFQGHNHFWIGAGNGTWFTGSANTKNQASGLAGDANVAHDLLISTMQSTGTYDRGITFGVDNNGAGTAGWRLGKWHSGDARDSSKLVVDGQIFAKGGYTDEYDYYANDYSAYYSSQGGTAQWTGDGGWQVPGIVSSTAIQIQSGNGGTNSRKPQLQFHQYGYGGIVQEYDGPAKVFHIKQTGSHRLNYAQLTTNYGYLEFGPMNSGYMHFQTDRSQFYFNKRIVVDEGVVDSYDEDLILRRASNNSHKLRINTAGAVLDGNLFINNASPTVYLQDTNHRSSMVHCNSNVFYVLRGTGTNSTGWTTYAGRWPLEINLENNDATFGGNVTAYSDRKLKKDIEPIGNSMEIFSKLNAKRYRWKETDEDDIGFIAQDVRDAGLGVFVKENERKDPATGEVQDTQLTLDYSRMSALLWDVVKQQQSQIDILTKRIEELENGNN